MNKEIAEKKLYSLLSLAQKAGMLKSGEFACETAFKAREVKLVIVCEDASDNTKKKFSQKAFFYERPYYVFGSKAGLAASLGKENRATCVITEQGFASKIEQLLKTYGQDEGKEDA